MIPASVKEDGKPVLCRYAGETVDAIPVAEFKSHPFGKICRDLVKTIWYGMAYGKGAYGFSTLIGADGKPIGEEVAGQMVDALLSAVPGMRRWFAWVEAFVREHHGIYSLGGRWCDLSLEMAGDEWNHRRAFRRAYNFPCQSTGADIISDAMVRISRCPLLRALNYRMCLQVHDELVLRGPLADVDEAMTLVCNHMTSATANGVPLLFPIQVSAGLRGAGARGGEQGDDQVDPEEGPREGGRLVRRADRPLRVRSPAGDPEEAEKQKAPAGQGSGRIKRRDPALNG